MTPPRWLEMKITIGNLLTMTVLVIGFIVGYVRLQDDQVALWREHNTLATAVKDHVLKDDIKFGQLASKETREMRDRAVDTMFQTISTQQKDIIDRLGRIERIHMGR